MSKEKKDPVDGQIVAAIKELGEVLAKGSLRKLQMLFEDNKNAAEIWLNAVRKNGNKKAIKSWNLLMHHNMIAWQAIGEVMDGHKEVIDKKYHEEFRLLVQKTEFSKLEPVGEPCNSREEAEILLVARKRLHVDDFAYCIERREATDWQAIGEVGNEKE